MERDKDKTVYSKHLKIECTDDNWIVVRNFVNLFIEEVSVGMHVPPNFLVACEEIYINISRYAYTHKPSIVDIQCSYTYDKREICIEFMDSGIEFDPTKLNLNNETLPLEKRKIGGLGILMAKKMSDFMCYSRVNDKNVLKLFKKIDKQRSAK